MFCTAGFHAASQNRLIYIVIINTVFVNENEDESIEAKPLIDNFPIWLLRIVFPHLPPPPTPNFKTWRQIQSRSHTNFVKDVLYLLACFKVAWNLCSLKASLLWYLYLTSMLLFLRFFKHFNMFEFYSYFCKLDIWKVRITSSILYLEKYSFYWNSTWTALNLHMKYELYGST